MGTLPEFSFKWRGMFFVQGAAGVKKNDKLAMVQPRPLLHVLAVSSLVYQAPALVAAPLYMAAVLFM